MSDPRKASTFETPLISARSYRSASETTSAAGPSRLPQRRPSISGDPHVTQTVGRLPIQRRTSLTGGTGNPGYVGVSYLHGASEPATASRLPTLNRRLPATPQNGAVNTHQGFSLASSIQSNLKRTSSIAGLNHHESDTSAIKRQSSRATQELEEAKLRHERELLEMTSTMHSLKSQVSEYAAANEKLERQRSIWLMREKEAEIKETELKQGHDNVRSELKQQLRVLRQELSGAKDRCVELDSSYRELNHSALQNTELAKAESSRAAKLEDEIKILRDEIVQKTDAVLSEKSKRSAIEDELQAALKRQNDGSIADVIKEELHRQVSHLRLLERENSTLKHRVEVFESVHTNFEILKEENRSLERKLAHQEGLRMKLAAFEAEADALKREKKEWSIYLNASETGDFDTPRKVTKTLAASRIENLANRERLDAITLDINSRDRLIGELEERIIELERKLQDEKNVVQQLSSAERKSNASQDLLRQEIEMLKRHLASYTTEEASQHEGNFDKQKTARLEELGSLLEAHKIQIKELQSQASERADLVMSDRKDIGASPITSTFRAENLREQLQLNEKLLSDIQELQTENTLLTKELEANEIQIENLETEIDALKKDLSMTYNPTTTKVLELSANPDSTEYAIRSATLDRLRQENQALLQRMLDLEKMKERPAGESNETMIPLQSLLTLQGELEAAQAKIVQKETMELRIKEAFTLKADEIRKAIHLLLGYRVDVLREGRIQIRSIYAPSKKHSLIFGPAAGGAGMEMVGTGDEKFALSDEMRRQVKFWMGERDSIPGFMASLTLTLFDETTRGGSAGFVTAE